MFFINKLFLVLLLSCFLNNSFANPFEKSTISPVVLDSGSGNTLGYNYMLSKDLLSLLGTFASGLKEVDLDLGFGYFLNSNSALELRLIYSFSKGDASDVVSTDFVSVFRYDYYFSDLSHVNRAFFIGPSLSIARWNLSYSPSSFSKSIFNYGTWANAGYFWKFSKAFSLRLDLSFGWLFGETDSITRPSSDTSVAQRRDEGGYVGKDFSFNLGLQLSYMF